MKIPKEIRIGGITFQVKRNCSFDDDREGDLDWDKSTIRIKKGLSYDAEWLTFLHELQHGIDFVYMNGKVKEQFGEDGIDVLGNGWYQVIQQLGD